MDESAVSKSNIKFWDELCGSSLAKTLGIVDSDPASLKRFDDWYFAYYPYLAKHIPFSELGGRDVLEVGLGYGSVAQRLATTGAHYVGLDIARGPVEMANLRLSQCGLDKTCVQGSILEPPFEPASFDIIVAIGCLHHTGDLQEAIDQCYRLLRPNGTLVLMVYYAYSYRRYFNQLMITHNYLLREFLGYRGVVGRSTSSQRAAYDSNQQGSSAPHTDWISRRSLRFLCRSFASFEVELENIDQQKPYLWTPREVLLRTRWPKIWGLDVYARVIK